MMLDASLFIDNTYKSKAYGIVQFEGMCDSDSSPTGVCFKFRTQRGQLKYILPSELGTFLDEDDNG